MDPNELRKKAAALAAQAKAIQAELDAPDCDLTAEQRRSFDEKGYFIVADVFSPDEVAEMRDIVRDAIKAGAIGFSTSRTVAHRTSDGDLTPTIGVSWRL